MKFIPKEVEMFQWFRNGDHPEDAVFRPYEDTGLIPVEPREGKIVRYFRHPSIPANCLCLLCEKQMSEHGWLENAKTGSYTVCPGDWIIKLSENNYDIRKDYFVKTFYKPITFT